MKEPSLDFILATAENLGWPVHKLKIPLQTEPEPGSRTFHTRQNQARGTGRQGMAPRIRELCSTRTSGNLHFGSSDSGGGATLVRLCLARMLLVRSASARLHLHLSNSLRQIAPNLLSGGQQTTGSAGATLDLFAQHFISRSRLHLHRFLNFVQQPGGAFSAASAVACGATSVLFAVVVVLACFLGQASPFGFARHARHLMFRQYSLQRDTDLRQRVRSRSETRSPTPFAAASTLLLSLP